jgi:hypothetical protein
MYPPTEEREMTYTVKTAQGLVYKSGIASYWRAVSYATDIPGAYVVESFAG